MNFNYNLIFKYLLENKKQIFLLNKEIHTKNTSILITANNLYYLSLHLKLSSFFYSNQLIDIFSYENTIPLNNLNLQNKNNKTLTNNFNNIISYNFNILKNNTRILLFIVNQNKINFSKNKKNKNSLVSITELFLNANWLEREAAELSGVFFYGKKDIRNLMLQYGDTSAPFKKSYPSVGLREIFYDSVSDLLVQQQTSIQF